MVFRTLVSASSKRIPMIKFRKGGLPTASDAGAQQTQSTASTTAKPPAQSSPPAIEDWELPPRYWRIPMSSEEMDYINRGGPA